jgi:hypothetical protein
MSMLKTGYPKVTTAVKTAAGKESTARAIDPADATVVLDDQTEVRVVEAVTQYVMQDTAEKAAKEAKEKSAEVIRTFTGTVRDENALDGKYQKTLRVMGRKVKGMQFAVDAMHTDKFTAPKVKDDILAIKALMGPAFDSVFEETIELSIKKSVMENDALRKELSVVLFNALGIEGIKKFFEKEETWKVKKGMAEDQYRLEKAVRETLRSKVKQAADAIKDASAAA